MNYIVGIYPSEAPGSPEIDSFVYTRDCSIMFDLVLEGGIDGLDGMSADDAEQLLEEAITSFVDIQESMEALNPESEEGCHTGALKFLMEIRTCCLVNPSCIIGVS